MFTTEIVTLLQKSLPALPTLICDRNLRHDIDDLVALTYPNVSLVKVTAKQNPITGQHVELQVQPTTEGGVDKTALITFLKEKLQPHMVPKRIKINSVAIGHRFKKS
jgi:acyl-CoA synthetase (AMP-forming)/AMP-acid ligase II